MKKAAVLTMVVGLLVASFVTPVQAIPAFKKHFDATYVKGNKDADFVKAAKAAKCNICHFGKKKANKNDYGTELGKLLKKKNYKGSRIKAEPKKVQAELKAAFDKVAKMKNKQGKTYGELIKAGKLPGTAPKQ